MTNNQIIMRIYFKQRTFDHLQIRLKIFCAIQQKRKLLKYQVQIYIQISQTSSDKSIFYLVDHQMGYVMSKTLNKYCDHVM